MQVMQMVLDPEVSLDKLSVFIKRDEGLSTKIMRWINTPRYSAVNGTMEIQKAVVTLGLNTIKNLALCLSLLDVLSNSVEEKVYKHIFDLSLCNATTTDVHNRSKFEQELERFLSLAKRRRHQLAIILIDFDDFKLFNNLHGDELGNEFLKFASLSH